LEIYLVADSKQKEALINAKGSIIISTLPG